jgi:hypothetical protein
MAAIPAVPSDAHPLAGLPSGDAGANRVDHPRHLMSGYPRVVNSGVSIRGDRRREETELVTREFLFHDFLHYAIESAVGTVRERMRRIRGRWKATPYGKTMEIIWAD